MALYAKRRRLDDDSPAIGFGTYKLGQRTEACVLRALRMGYRLIDCAQVYSNEKAVGAAIARSKIPREEIWVESKIWKTKHGYDNAKASCLQSLKDLNLGTVDIMLIHHPDCKRGWPLKSGQTLPRDWTPKMRQDTWRAMEDLHFSGKLKRIGVSNYSKRHLEELLQSCRVKPYVNQIELHPMNQQQELVQFCRDQGIRLQAFASLGGGDSCGKLLQHTDVQAVATQLGKTSAQVLLKWAVAKGFHIIPKTSSELRMKENMDLDFELNEQQMASLDRLECGKRLTWKGVDPASIE